MMCYRFGGVHFWLLLFATTAYSSILPQITTMRILSEIDYRFATTQIIFDVKNTQSNTQDFDLAVQLPTGSLVSNVSLFVNNTLYDSKIQQISEEYKKWLSKTHSKLRPVKDKSLYFGSNVFFMSVPMAGRSKGQFKVTYSYLLHRQNNTYQLPVYILFRQGQFVQDIQIKINVREPRKITNLSVKLLREDSVPILIQEQKVKFNPHIKRLSPHHVLIKYNTSLGSIRDIFSRMFLLEYSLKQDSSIGDILWAKTEGLFFFSPPMLEPLQKDIVFTIDYTDSMKDQKLLELQKGFARMLQMMSRGDRFNVILYNSKVFRWRDSLQPVTDKNIENAVEFLKTVPAIDLSDFNLAIEESLSQLKKSAISKNRPRVVYFFTDGWHSSNNINRHEISKYFRKNNKNCKAIFFTVALHSKADYILMKTLSNLSGGKMLRINENQNLSDSMINFFREMNTPLLTNISVVGVNQNTYNYPGIKDYYQGTEKILYFNKSNINITDGGHFAVSAFGAGGKLIFPNTINNAHSKKYKKKFLAKYLDFLFIRMVIDRKLKKRRKEAISRSERSGFLTPWTYLSALPKTYNLIQDSEQDLLDEGVAIVGRGFTGSGVGDPHFTIGIPGLKRPVCFDLNGHADDVINLMADDTENIFVNAKIIKASNNSRKTYLGEIWLVRANRMWIITPNGVEQTTSESVEWKNIVKMNKSNGSQPINDIDDIHQSNTRSINDISFRYSGFRTLTVTAESKIGKIEFLLRRSKTKHQAKKIGYLNFFLTNSSGLSRSTNGLIGQFINWKANITKLHMQPSGKIESWIELENEGRNRTFKAVLTQKRRSMFLHQQCWTVWQEGKGFIQGKYEDYLTRGLNAASLSPPQR